mgnify:CR=1 FL=1
MKLDLAEPYWLISNCSDEVRKEFWNRAHEILSQIQHDIWVKKVLALGKDKFIHGRMNGLKNMSQEELDEMQKRLEILYEKIERGEK